MGATHAREGLESTLGVNFNNFPPGDSLWSALYTVLAITGRNS